MATNPLHAAISQAQRDNSTLQTLFARYLGTAQNPRGRVLTAYRGGRQAMAQALREPRPLGPAQDALTSMRATLRATGREGLQTAADAGRESAERQLAAYRADGLTGAQGIGERPDVDALLNGWMATFDQQADAILAVLAAGQDPTLVLGDEGRLGLLQPAPMAAEGSYWLAAALALGLTAWAIGGQERRSRVDWDKQAIAALDERTTDCCLRVHAQIVRLRERFRLTGTPRYADRMDWSPFHWWCRTSVVLYLAQFEDGISQQMRDAADAELERRTETGGRVEIHPAHGRSRR